MNCEEIGMLLEVSLDEPEHAARRRVTEHLAACGNCRDALRAVGYLRAERNLPVPPPRPGAFDRALDRAIKAATVPQMAGRRRTGEYWKGLAVGAAAAAGIAVLAASLILSGSLGGGDALPEVRLALHEPRDVSIAIQAPEALRNAEIHVVLRGAVDLEGFEGQRDIRWTTDLDPGINELTLPVVAIGEQGGQVQVVVQHGNGRKTFIVDVHAAQAG